MPPQRPNGTPPHDFMVNFKEFLSHKWPKSLHEGKPLQSPVERIDEKCDGFYVKIEFHKTVRTDKNGSDYETTEHLIFTKNGHSYESTFPALHKVIMSRIKDIEYSRIRHFLAGEVTALYGELYVVDDGQHNLKMLMDRASMRILPTDMIFRLKFFNCDFEKDSVDVPLAEKLDRMSAVVPVVQNLFDEREIAGIKTYGKAVKFAEKVIGKIDTFLTNGGEGLVASIKTGKSLKDRRTIKHKPQRPLKLHIVAVIFEEKQGVKIPSKFAWAIRHTERCYSIIHIDEKGILCDPARTAQGKRYIPPSSFVRNGNGSYTIAETGYAADSYNGVLSIVDNKFQRYATAYKEERMVNENGLKHMKETAIDEVTVNGIRYHIAPNRKFSNMHTQYHFLQSPVEIIVGCNKLWLNKSSNGGIHDLAAAVHVQAALVLATKDYGKEIYRDLLKMNMDQNILVKMAQTHDLQEHALLLATCRYGEGKKFIDLIYGDVEEIDQCEYSSGSELGMEDQIMLDEYKGKYGKEAYNEMYESAVQEKADKAAKRPRVQLDWPCNGI